jgi:hypothetical protein
VTRDSAGRFPKGVSGNPRGVSKAKQAPGSDGVIAYGGFLQTGERNSNLVGTRKWVTYANMFSRPPVAIAHLLRDALLSGVKWSLVPNGAGGKDAERGVEIVQQGLLDARLRRPWNRVAAKAGNGSFFNGFSLHAFAMGRRPDGMVVFTDLAHRPQHTAYRWLRSRGDTGEFDTVEQMIPGSGAQPQVPLAECLYMVDDSMGDSPEGVGVLRLIAERVRRVENYEVLEGSEMFSGMGGTPIARVPLTDIASAVSDLPDAEQTAKKKALVQSIETIVSSRIKTPEKQQYVVLDSGTYQGSDPNTISAIKKWDIEILKAELGGLPDIRKVITDEDLNIARMLGVEFVFVGGGDSSGSYGMHESKVGLFAAALKTTNADVATAARDQLARRLVAANGLDPDTATPTLIPSPVTVGSVLEAAQALALIAGLHPKDPARNVLREREDLPPEPEDAMQESLMMPRFGGFGSQTGGPGAAPIVPGEDPNAAKPGEAAPVPGEEPVK